MKDTIHPSLIANFEWINAAPIVKEALLTPEGQLVISSSYLDVTEHVEKYGAGRCVCGTFEGEYNHAEGYCGSFTTEEGKVLLIDGGTVLVDPIVSNVAAESTTVITITDKAGASRQLQRTTDGWTLVDDGKTYTDDEVIEGITELPEGFTVAYE